MSVITNIITSQAFEIIRDRIGEILKDEIDNQYQLSYDDDLDVTVCIERFIPFNNTELPAINVMLSRGNYSNQHQGQSDGTYTYNIDVYTKANTSSDNDGDSLAVIKLHRLIGICRYILEDPKYKTLGFSSPIISNRHADEINIAVPDPQDATSSVMGRLTFAVRSSETNQLITPSLLPGYLTRVKLFTTNKGYVFSDVSS